MSQFQQLPLFESPTDQSSLAEKSDLSSKELGTFKESMRAPIHGWFRYPAGYSYRFVDNVFQEFAIKAGHWVYDPFSGTGTTLVCAKQQGIHAYGVEAHSFVHFVSEVKLYWEFDLVSLEHELDQLLNQCRIFVSSADKRSVAPDIFPALVYKCYHPHDLAELYLIREFILNEINDQHVRDFMKLALTDTLRSAAAAGTGWPYISPRQNSGTKPPKNALVLFTKTVRKMYSDLYAVAANLKPATIRNVLGDSRQKQDLQNEQVTLALTSPPYLNNYDYADRTRLETYFWGITQSWKDITEQFRDKLIVAATTQVIRSQYNLETVISPEIQLLAPEVYKELQKVTHQLSVLRLSKGGKKDYDLMVALYFNDILRILQETYRVIKKSGHFCLVLGDSAPYGVHIPTEQFIGALGLGVGFRSFDYREFRKRGEKWKANPQRHTVKLREGVIILEK